MDTLQTLFTAERETLMQALAAQRDVSAATDAVRACLGRLQQRYIALQEDAQLRGLASSLFMAASSAAGVLLGAEDTEIHLRLPEPSLLDRRVMGLARPFIAYVPLLLCVLVSVMLFARGNTFMILLSLAATASVAWQTIRAGKGEKNSSGNSSVPTAYGEVRVNPDTVASAVEHICVAIDRILRKREEEGATDATQPTWSAQQLIAVQMLWEAMQTRDGQYALGAVPALLSALEAQDLQLVLYSPEVAQYFETLPAREGGQTIRPALLSGKRLLARGQVTVPMA